MNNTKYVIISIPNAEPYIIFIAREYYINYFIEDKLFFWSHVEDLCCVCIIPMQESLDCFQCP